jgi:hypothetical protein
MTTNNQLTNAARAAGHPSVELLTAAEADAIGGGRLIDDVGDFLEKAYNGGKKVYDFAKEAYKVGKKVKKFFEDLF